MRVWGLCPAFPGPLPTSWPWPLVTVLSLPPCFLPRFRSKYHPDEVGKRRQEARGALQNRLRVFLSLMETGWFDNLLLDIDRADSIVKMLDAGMCSWRAGGCLVTKILAEK